MKQREKEDIYKYWYLKDLRLADDVAIMRIDIKCVNVTKPTIWKVSLQ